MEEFRDASLSRIVRFLAGIGIAVRAGELAGETILPGITIDRGTLVIDEARLRYPGDLLHEAGHLAVLTPEARSAAGGDSGDEGGLEMAAIAWSYAAALHLGMDPAIVFHEGGYRGGSDSILENFRAGRYFGVPMLEWLGLTAGVQRASQTGTLPYPNMLRWLRT